MVVRTPLEAPLEKDAVALLNIEQFNDKNVTRKQQVLDDLVTFVGANQRVTPNDLPRSNVLDHKSKAIDICI